MHRLCTQPMSAFPWTAQPMSRVMQPISSWSSPGWAVLHAGILEGRKASGNVLKYLLMGTSSNFGNMLSMAGASLFLPFLPMLPDTDSAQQLLI